MDKVVLNQNATISAKEGTVIATINGKNYPFIEATEVSAKVTLNKADVPRIGTRMLGKKVVSAEGTGTFNGYKVSSVMVSEILQSYLDKGIVPEMSITATNEDPTSPIGKQTVVLTGVILDDINLFLVGTDDDVVVDETDFTFDGVQVTNKFTDPQRA